MNSDDSDSNDSDNDMYISSDDDMDNDDMKNEEFNDFLKGKIKMKDTEQKLLNLYYLCGEKYLNIDINYLTYDKYNNKPINICWYTINKKLKTPFIEYLLYKSDENELIFPKISNTNMNSAREIFERTDNYTNEMIKMLFINDKTYMRYIPKGYYLNNDSKEIYIFVELFLKPNILVSNYEKNDVKNNQYYFVCFDEIMNSGYTYNIKIADKVCDFFIENDKFICICDIDNNVCINPIVCYVDKSEREIEYTLSFGLNVCDRGSILGPYYYFTNYDGCLYNIMKNSNNNNNIKTRKGVLKFIIFTEKMNVLLNYPNDNIDDSEYKKTKLLLDKSDREKYNFDILTMKISDYKGNWTNNYDSVYVGLVNLDDDNVLMKYPLWVLREKQNFIYHSYISVSV